MSRTTDHIIDEAEAAGMTVEDWLWDMNHKQIEEDEEYIQWQHEQEMIRRDAEEGLMHLAVARGTYEDHDPNYETGEL